MVNQQTSVACFFYVACLKHFDAQSANINLGTLKYVSSLTFCMAAEAAVWRMLLGRLSTAVEHTVAAFLAATAALSFSRRLM